MIYFAQLRNGRAVKIGYTANVTQRFKDLNR
jgi:hypothetical protein